jgi:hypothetical protein
MSRMSDLITITVANTFVFTAQLLTDRAPNTCAAFTALLPYRQQLIHARWSGEACWIPLGDYQLGVGYENHTSHPSRGDLLWYPGGISETELLFAYGSSRFASKVGQLAGNHFLEIIDGKERLEEMGRYVLYRGAQDIAFEAATFDSRPPNPATPSTA